MISQKLYRRVADYDGTPERGEARRFMRHAVSLTSTKLADGLIDPKLVLSWLLSALGAPGYLIGALVPVREAGALLPQLLMAREIQAQRIRKGFWAAGSLLQGLAALGIAAAAYFFSGALAGWIVLACLTVLSLARAACSASYKDVLARTLPKGTRGTVSGLAGTVAATLVFAAALLLGFGLVPREVPFIAGMIAFAGLLWIIASLVFVRLDEPRAEPSNDSFSSVETLLAPLRKDGEFRRYVAVRGLLIATALAPPFLVMLSNSGGDATFGNLGLLMVASSAAAIASSYIWGRLSDRSSRFTLVFAGALAALGLGGAAATGFATGGLMLAPVFVFIAQIAYEGVRAGRKTHLTDMDTHGTKAVYTALSNTMIGMLLLLGGSFGLLADLAGPSTVLAVFAGLSAAAAILALSLSEVQEEA
jgi:hypothetical protein